MSPTRSRRRRQALAAAVLVAAAPFACRAPEPESPAGAGASTDTLPGGAGGSASSPATADTTAPVTVRTDARRYAPGAPITLTVASTGDGQYAFNPCTRRLEREADGAWRAVEEPGRVCTMEAWILEPRGTRTGGTELPASLEAGRYRVLLSLTREGTTPPAEHVTAASPPFEVAP